MKKARVTIILLIMGLMVLPVGAKASEHNKAIAETTKYYKTTVYNTPSSTKAYSDLATKMLPESETVEVTEEEYNNANTESSMAKSQTTIETTYKKMVFSIAPNGNYYRYTVTLTWKNMPSKRSYDTISIGFPSTVKAKGSPIFKNEYCLSGTCYTATGYAYRYSGSYGIAATFQQPTGSLTSLKETFYVDICKNTTSTIIKLVGAGDYAHATSTISLTKAKKYSVSLIGIEFEQAAINYYDSIQAAYAEMAVNW